MKKSACIFILAAMFCAVFTACGPGAENNAVTEEVPVIAAADLSQYTYIREEKAEGDCLDTMVALYERIKGDYCETMAIKTDYIKKGTSAGEFEILVGNTNREESAEFISMLRKGDYGYVFVNSKLVIAGSDSEGTIKAIEAFTADILDKTDAETFFSADSGRLYKIRYPAETLKINGVDISEYTIVYNKKGTLYEEYMAKRLQSDIETVCGVCVETEAASSPYEAGAHEILVGASLHSEALTSLADDAADLSGDMYLVGAEGGAVWITGAGFAGLLDAEDDFAARLMPSGHAEVHDVTITGVSVYGK